MSSLIVETILREVEGDVRFNVAADARTFDCKFIEPGLISYRDHEKGGIELLRRETIERAMPTCIGNPLTLHHVLVTSNNRMQEEHGIITSWYYNPNDGWFWVKGYVDTPSAQVKIKAGKKPSCGYIVRSFGPSGKHHDIRYDKELTEIVFNHLAIVDRPRFEDAEFRLNSKCISIHVSQPNNENHMNQVFTFLKKLVTRSNGADGKPTESTQVESHKVEGSTEVEIDGKRVPIHEVVEGFRKNSAAPVVAAPAADALQLAESDEVEVDGTKVPLKTLIEGYRKNAAAETPEQKAAREKTEAAARATAGESFVTLHNARLNAAPAEEKSAASTRSGSITDRILEGQKRYGSLVVVAGKN